MAMRKLDPPPELIENIKKMNNIFPLMNTVKEPITEHLMNADFDFIKAKLVSVLNAFHLYGLF